MKLFTSILIICLVLPHILFGQDITYYKDIAPLLETKCNSCHKVGDSGPFPLLTYEDVAKRASFIKEVTQRRYMPPWKADNHYVLFANDRSLTTSEIAMIGKWVDNKMPKGKQPVSTAVQKNSAPSTIYGRKPDLVLKVSDTFHVTGDGLERYLVYKIPFELKDSANVEAVEFYSNNKQLIHHANYAVHSVPDETIDIKKTLPFINLTEDDRRKFDQYRPYQKIMTYYGGWIPGAGYESYPKEFGWVMPKRGVILLTIHYAPSGSDEASISGINLFFTKTPISRKVKVISFGSGGIGERQIDPPFFMPANTEKKFVLEVTNPNEDQSILYVWPHMHLIGKDFKAYVTSAAGDTTKLVYIPRWDFRWQEIYRFRQLVKVTRGSVIHMECTYDNTAENPFNPNSPPKAIFSRGDMKTTDEMMTLMMIFLPYKEGDEQLKLVN
ncbi:MAG: cytochrome c [Chitinophagaceae bacterium]